MTKNADLTLRDYVRELGYDEFAKRFGCSHSLAVKYARGERRPRFGGDVHRRLVKKSPLTIEGIFGPV